MYYFIDLSIHAGDIEKMQTFMDNLHKLPINEDMEAMLAAVAEEGMKAQDREPAKGPPLPRSLLREIRRIGEKPTRSDVSLQMAAQNDPQLQPK